MNSDRSATPLIGRTGVRLVASDVLAGGVALPAAALLRDLLGAAGSALGTPAGTPSELGRPALWLSAAISLLLWPLAIRALDADGIEVSDLVLRRPTLDDVFMSLTGHAAEDDTTAAKPAKGRRGRGSK
jgi:ABC-2 type transport system ATP-binding protein